MFRRKKRVNNGKTRHLITKLNPRSPISEQFRTIRTNLQFSSVDESLQVILITSPEPGAGKSLTAANLAVTYAQQGKKVLLVDADMRIPTIHYTFRLDNLRGLSTILVGECTLEDAIANSDVDHLDLISCGPIPPNPAELLASNQMAKVLSDARKLYDIIILDTPPVLASADAQILTTIVDGTLLVIRSKYTKYDACKKAKELLETSNAKLLGVILNDVDKKKCANYYYYHGTN